MGELDEMQGDVSGPVILGFADKKRGMDLSTASRAPGHTVGF